MVKFDRWTQKKEFKYSNERGDMKQYKFEIDSWRIIIWFTHEDELW